VISTYTNCSMIIWKNVYDVNFLIHNLFHFYFILTLFLLYFFLYNKFDSYFKLVCKIYTTRFLKQIESMEVSERTKENFKILKFDALKEFSVAVENSRPSTDTNIWNHEVINLL
jgi:hypothetical protein